MARVQLEKVSKIYTGGVKAVDAIDLDIANREFVVLVGPSGCGKSTTLRMVAGLEDISAGIIRIGDRVVNDMPPKNRDIAMVFQNYALYPHMSVYKNMAFALRLRTPPWWNISQRGKRREMLAQVNQRVMESARMLEIEHLLDRKPKQLSGGQRQRVAVGRAIVREPAAFLFDEPLSNLDAKLRVTTRAELKRLHQRLKTTTIYVTHDQEEAMTLGDRIVVMRDGIIQQADTPLNTYNRPVNRFVAGFIGMPPMNFFDGTIRADAGQLFFEEGVVAKSDLSASDGKTSGIGELTLPGNGFRLPISQASRPGLNRLSSKVGRHVVLGIRPEHLHLRPVEGASAGIQVRLNVIEPLGSNMDVYMNTALRDHVVGRLEARDGVQVGAETTVYVDLRKIDIFEPGATGMNLSLETLSPTSEFSHALA
jgi:multiple sugar transport system ATP-binding protein